VVAVAALAAGVSGHARAASPEVKIGEPVARFDFGVSPTALPSGSGGPATLRIGIEEEGSDGIPPGIATATIGLERSIGLDARGLPICPWGVQIDAAGPDECDRTVVGCAEAVVEVAFPESTPIELHSQGTIFNGGFRHGATYLLVKLPFARPVAGTLDLIVPVRPVQGGRIGSEAAIKIPGIAGGNGHLTSLQLELGRSFVRHGEPTSYVTAECRNGKLVASASIALSGRSEEQSEAIRACTRG
jgi:hypothetical protein